MPPQAQPSPDIRLLLELNANVAALMERTEGLPDLRDGVARLDERVSNLAQEIKHLRTGAVHVRARLSFLRGEWKTLAVIAGFLAEHFWKR